MLVLKKCGEIKISADPQICFYKFVVELDAAGNEIAVG